MRLRKAFFKNLSFITKQDFIGMDGYGQQSSGSDSGMMILAMMIVCCCCCSMIYLGTGAMVNSGTFSLGPLDSILTAPFTLFTVDSVSGGGGDGDDDDENNNDDHKDVVDDSATALQMTSTSTCVH